MNSQNTHPKSKGYFTNLFKKFGMKNSIDNLRLEQRTFNQIYSKIFTKSTNIYLLNVKKKNDKILVPKKGLN